MATAGIAFYVLFLSYPSATIDTLLFRVCAFMDGDGESGHAQVDLDVPSHHQAVTSDSGLERSLLWSIYTSTADPA